MRNVVYSSSTHQSTIEAYINLCKQFAQDVSTKSKYHNYLDVLDTILEYHNAYGQEKSGDFYSWLMVIPINLGVMTNGFFAGVETKKNAAVVRAYKVVLSQMLNETVAKLDFIEPTNE